MDMKEAREQLDQIDTALAKLFIQRMDITREIAAYKREHGLPIEDKKREAQVIAEHSSQIPDEIMRSYYVQFQQNMMDVSKRWQHRLMSGVQVAYCGVEGAFAYIAAKRIFPDGTMVSHTSFEEAYASVVQGECDLAVLPIENSFAGEVGQVMDLMFSGNLYVNGVYDLSVSHDLLGIPDAHIEDIQKVVSHPQALAQCGKYIREHGYDAIEAENTAMASQMVAEQGDLHTAAIASRESAELYGLRILDHDIHESKANTTRFAVFSRVESRVSDQKEGAFILLFTVNDEIGGLAKAINIISAYNFNMRVLRSRPMKELPWHYYFYTEVEGSDTSNNGRQMLSVLKGVCPMVKVVGHYTATVNALQGGESI